LTYAERDVILIIRIEIILSFMDRPQVPLFSSFAPSDEIVDAATLSPLFLDDQFFNDYEMDRIFDGMCLSFVIKYISHTQSLDPLASMASFTQTNVIGFPNQYASSVQLPQSYQVIPQNSITSGRLHAE
jgi:hypothetical protein